MADAATTSHGCQVVDPPLIPLCVAVQTTTGLHCENPVTPHVHHWVSEHTLQHNFLGSGYPCDHFDPKEPTTPCVPLVSSA